MNFKNKKRTRPIHGSVGIKKRRVIEVGKKFEKTSNVTGIGTTGWGDG